MQAACWAWRQCRNHKLQRCAAALDRIMSDRCVCAPVLGLRIIDVECMGSFEEALLARCQPFLLSSE